MNDMGGFSQQIITQWQSEPIAFSAVTTPPTKGTIVTDKIYWRRVGDSMEIKIDYEHSTAGSAGSGAYLVIIPGGFNIDTTKVRANTNTGLVRGVCGTGFVGDFASYTDNLLAMAYDSRRLRFSSLQTGAVSNTNRPMSATLYSFTVPLSVPIVEWG